MQLLHSKAKVDTERTKYTASRRREGEREDGEIRRGFHVSTSSEEERDTDTANAWKRREQKHKLLLMLC